MNAKKTPAPEAEAAEIAATTAAPPAEAPTPEVEAAEIAATTAAPTPEAPTPEVEAAEIAATTAAPPAQAPTPEVEAAEIAATTAAPTPEAPTPEVEAPATDEITADQLADIMEALAELDPVTGSHDARASWLNVAAEKRPKDPGQPLAFLGLGVRAPDGRPETYLENWLNAARRLLRREGFNV